MKKIAKKSCNPFSGMVLSVYGNIVNFQGVGLQTRSLLLERKSFSVKSAEKP